MRRLWIRRAERVARQLHAVNAEHLAADEPLTVTNRGPRREDVDDVEQHRGRVGLCARRVVPEPDVKPAQVEIVVEPMLQRMFEGPREELPGHVHGQEPCFRVDIVATRDAGLDGESSTAWNRGTVLPILRAGIGCATDLFRQSPGRLTETSNDRRRRFRWTFNL